MEFIQISSLGNEFTMNTILEKSHTMLIKKLALTGVHTCAQIPVINDSYMLKVFLKPATPYHSELFPVDKF